MAERVNLHWGCIAAVGDGPTTNQCGRATDRIAIECQTIHVTWHSEAVISQTRKGWAPTLNLPVSPRGGDDGQVHQGVVNQSCGPVVMLDGRGHQVLGRHIPLLYITGIGVVWVAQDLLVVDVCIASCVMVLTCGLL